MRESKVCVSGVLVLRVYSGTCALMQCPVEMTVVLILRTHALNIGLRIEIRMD